MPCDSHSLVLTAFSAPPSFSTPLRFASLRPAFPLDQTPPLQPRPGTCSTSTQLRPQPLRCSHQHWQVASLFVCIPVFNVYSVFFRFLVRKIPCICTFCLLWKIPVLEHWSPTLLLQFSMLSLPYRYENHYVESIFHVNMCLKWIEA